MLTLMLCLELILRRDGVSERCRDMASDITYIGLATILYAPPFFSKSGRCVTDENDSRVNASALASPRSLLSPPPPHTVVVRVCVCREARDTRRKSRAARHTVHRTHSAFVCSPP